MCALGGQRGGSRASCHYCLWVCRHVLPRRDRGDRPGASTRDTPTAPLLFFFPSPSPSFSVSPPLRLSLRNHNRVLYTGAERGGFRGQPSMICSRDRGARGSLSVSQSLSAPDNEHGAMHHAAHLLTAYRSSVICRRITRDPPPFAQAWRF